MRPLPLGARRLSLPSHGTAHYCTANSPDTPANGNFSKIFNHKNVVGYQTVEGIQGDQFKALAVQFENVAGGEIAVKDLVQVGNPAGAASVLDTADQIWRWNTESATWDKYFFRAQRGTAYGWCRAGETSETADTIPAGETFFFRRGTGATATGLTIAGAVREFEGSSVYSVSSDQLVFMANPWPVETTIKDFANFQASPAGAASILDTADQIWRWNTASATWDKYFYRKQRTTVYGWCKAGETSETTDTIPAGEGFFFRRGTGAAQDTVSFAAPSAE